MDRFGFLGDDKKPTGWHPPDDHICFASLDCPNIVPDYVKYIVFYPRKEEFLSKKSRLWWKFIKQFPLLEDKLTTRAKMLREGILFDIDKHSGFEIVTSFMLVRYPYELRKEGYIDIFNNLAANLPKNTPLFNVWALSHVLLYSGNYNHTIIGFGYKKGANYEKFTQEAMLAGYPKQEVYRKDPTYRTACPVTTTIERILHQNPKRGDLESETLGEHVKNLNPDLLKTLFPRTWSNLAKSFGG